MLAHFLFDAVHDRFIEDTSFRETDFLERLFEILLGEFVGAADADTGDRGAFDNADNQHVALTFEPHVAKEAGLEQRPQRLLRVTLGDRVADLDRQVIEYRARGDALQALDANVADHEGVRGMNRRAQARG